MTDSASKGATIVEAEKSQETERNIISDDEDEETEKASEQEEIPRENPLDKRRTEIFDKKDPDYDGNESDEI